MRHILPLLFLSACSDYDLVAKTDVPEGSDDDTGFVNEIDVSDSCQHDRSAYIDAQVVSLGQNSWIPGLNTIAKFTLTTDKDTCFDETFTFNFASTDNANTDWNDCTEYEGQDRLSIFRVIGTQGDEDILEEIPASWTFQGATGDWDSYVHYCEAGRFIMNATPWFGDEDTVLMAGNPLTFVVKMEAEGSTEPQDRMMVTLAWDHTSRVNTNSANHHQREGDLLPFENSNE